MSLPQPKDIARVLPAALAEAGGSVTLSGLEERLGQGSKFKVTGMTNEQQTEYLRGAFLQAVEILIRSGSAKHRDGEVTLTDQGWAQARRLGVTPQRPREHTVYVLGDTGTDGGVSIDVSHAQPVIRMSREDGTEIVGYLRDGYEALHGRPFTPPASKLLDDLYRAEVNGVPSGDGFYTTVRDIGVFASAVQLLEQKCHVYLPGLQREERAPRSTVNHIGRGGRPGRRPGMTWERLVCEVLGELGGHADWPTIAETVGRRPMAEQHSSWRSECIQALRNHTAPAGRGYFELTEVGGRPVYALTEQGERMAARRTEDTRAPTLSKLLAKAISADGDGKLTDYELYALLHLAVELGKPAEAQAIYHLLPEDFPDEDRYHMAQHLLARAEELRDGRG